MTITKSQMPDHPIWSANERTTDNNLYLMAENIQVGYVEAYYNVFWKDREHGQITA